MYTSRGKVEKMTNDNKDQFFSRFNKLRERLLDLSNRNPLLSVRHSPRSNRYIRVIDELPNELFRHLSNGNILSFRELPEPSDYTIDLPDEETDEFLDLYNLAKVTDEQYISEMKELEEGEDKYTEFFAIDRRLRDRLRDRLGFNRLLPTEKLSIQDIAKRIGINPSYELPRQIIGEAVEAKYKDKSIQTLFRRDELRAKMKKLDSNVRLDLEESGVNTFYAVFGFLERYENSNSDRPFFSPLLLQQLKPMQKKLPSSSSGGEKQFEVRGDSEPPQTNIALAKKLLKDHDLVLPMVTPDESPESYFEEVEKAISNEAKWRVRRWVTFGTFSFSGNIMYQDLDPNNWESPNALVDNRIIRSFISAGNEGLADTNNVHNTAEVYDIDRDVDVLQYAPKLILNADSSQHSAIVDIMRGDDVAIKGPPGTGKSQTIVNTIANAMFSGKTVLFVAQKKAALDVVYDRIKDAGLEEFCLRVHSARTAVGDILDDIKLAVNEKEKNVFADRKTIEYGEIATNLRLSLRDYADAVTSEYGAANLTVYEHIWNRINTQELRHDISPTIANINVENAAMITQSRLEEYDKNLKDLESLDDLNQKYGEIDHPWRGVTVTSNDRFIVPEIIDSFDSGLFSIQRLQESAKVILAKHPDVKMSTLSEVSAFLDSVQGIEQVDMASISQKLLHNFLESRNHLNTAERYVAARSRILHAKVKSEEVVADAEASLEGSESALELMDIAKTLRVEDKPNHAIDQDIEKRRQELEACEGLKNLTDNLGMEIFGVVSGTITVEQLRLLAEVPKLHDEVKDINNRANLRLISENYFSVSDRIADYQRTVEWIVDEEKVMSRRFLVDHEFTADELQWLLEELGKNRIFPILSKQYRRAKRMYASMRKGDFKSWIHSNDEIQDIWTMLAIRRKREEMDEDRYLNSLFGFLVSGIGTNFESIHHIMAQVSDVLRKFGGGNRNRELMRQWCFEHIEREEEFGILADVVYILEANEDLFTQSASANMELEQLMLNKSNEIKDLSALSDYLGSTAANDEVTYRMLKKCHESDLKDYDNARRAVRDIQQELDKLCYQIEVDVSGNHNMLEMTIVAAETLMSTGVADTINDISDSATLNRMWDELIVSAFDLKTKYADVVECLNAAWKVGRVSIQEYLGAPDDSNVTVERIQTRLQRSLSDRNSLGVKIKLAGLEQQAFDDQLHYAEMLEKMKRERKSYKGAAEIFKHLCYRSACRGAIRTSVQLSPDDLKEKAATKKKFMKLDEEYIQLCRLEVIDKHRRVGVPNGKNTGKIGEYTEMGLIRREIEKKTRFVRLRDLVLRAGIAMQRLKPCILMSPASVAKYIPPNSIVFDIAIIDEASQVPLEESIGTLARCKNVAVVGDQEQLPPTSYFKRRAELDCDDEQKDEIGTESVLDVAINKCKTSRCLEWHYRSKHESLIDFSNRCFYDSRLFIHPSPRGKSRHSGVNNRYVEGVYEARRNEEEANAVVEEARVHMTTSEHKSLGIVTMNEPQRQLIEDKMDQLIRRDKRCEEFREKWRNEVEYFFVKNLENVQGDERDVIMISTVYGPNRNGVVEQRFGPINQKHGHRRLNVLFTRAKCSVQLFTSMTPEDIKIQKSKADHKKGLLVLQNYLKYAATGVFPGQKSGRCPDSEFEIDVMRKLEDQGYVADPQIGVSRYFIDIGVKHPNWEYGYILGVECDGSAYHSSRSARDSDRLRQLALEAQGWDIYIEFGQQIGSIITREK